MPCLSHEAIGELEAAKHHAGTLGLPLNTHLSFTPFADTPALPSPADIADSFGRLLKHLSVWVKRRTGCRFTYIRVAHTDDDGSGRNPHLHVLLHLPTDDDRGELQAALLKLYGYTATGLVADVRSGTTKRKRNECGYWPLSLMVIDGMGRSSGGLTSGSRHGADDTRDCCCSRLVTSRHLAVFVGELAHLLADGRTLQLHRSEARSLHQLRPDLNEGRGAGLFIAVDQQHVAPPLRQGNGDVDRQRG